MIALLKITLAMSEFGLLQQSSIDWVAYKETKLLKILEPGGLR